MTSVETTTDLRKELGRLLFRQRFVLFLAGIALTAAAAAAAWLILSVLAYLVVIPVWFKLLLLAAATGLTGWQFWLRAIRPLGSGSVDAVAVLLEERHPDMKGALIAAVQFAAAPPSTGYSRELIEATHAAAVQRARQIDGNEIISYQPISRAGQWVAIPFAASLAALILWPGFFSNAYEVYSNPTAEIAPPLSYQLTSWPGSVDWIKYRDITIGASLTGHRLPETAILHYRYAGGNWQSERFDVKALRRSSAAGGDSLLIAHTLRQVSRSFDYYVEAGKRVTQHASVNVVDRPRVEGLKVSVFPPPYTGLAPSTFDENNGSVAAVVGTRVSLDVSTNLPVTQAELVFDDSSVIPLALTEAGKRAETSLSLETTRSYFIRLRDHLGESNPDPIAWTLTAIPDAYPVIEVLSPGFDANLGDDMILPVLLRIQDDFGFTSLTMKYTVVKGNQPSQERIALLHYPERIKTEGEVDFRWDMDQLDLSPGDYALYHFELADNDRIGGPKISATRQYMARVPSLDELTAEIEGANEQRIERMEDLSKSGKELVNRLKQAARSIDAKTRDAKPADWKEQQELQAIAQKNEEMIQKLDEMAQAMEQSVEKTQDNALMSRQIVEKMQQVQKLFEEIATPEMREAQKKLMEALQQMDRDQMQQAMKDFQMSQQQMLERLERTLALLKKMQVEQKMEAMLRKAEELLKKQEELAAKADSAKSPAELAKLSEQQKQNEAAMQSLKEETAELEQAMNEAGMQESAEAKKFSEAVKRSPADQSMQKSSQAMKEGKQSDAKSQSKQARKELAEMLAEMQQQQLAMQGSDSQESEKAMKQAMDDANSLSMSQEELMKEAAAMQQGSMMMRDLAQQQQDLQSATGALRRSIEEMAKESPFVASELDRLVQSATQQMEQAAQHLDQKNSVQASLCQREAMSQLNKASNRLMESMEQSKKCNNPSGSCNKGMPKLESMAQKQQQLNQQTQQCNNPQQGKPGEGNSQAQARQELQRLAGEQAGLRKSLQELEEEFAGSRQILGRLDDIAQEMKKVEEDMADGEIGEETQARQLKIYSRMLEATRSMQRKDFSEQRQSESATTRAVFLPDQLKSELLNDRGALEDRLRKFLGDSYPPQYQEQIKAYFRSLLQVESSARTAQPPAQR